MGETKVYFLVIEHIKSLVQQGTLSFGGKLPSERQLMTTLGLSRNSIREALRSLENMGIVESRHGQGSYLVNHIADSLGGIFSLLVFMNECSEQEIRELRRGIEIGACLAAVRQTPDRQLSELLHCLELLKNCSPQERPALDKRFHDTLIRISGNRLLMLLSGTLSQLFEHTIRDAQTHLCASEWDDLLSCHAQLCDSLAARSETACVDAVMRHYDLTDSRT